MNMWFWYALGFALSSSLGTILSKKILQKTNEKDLLLISSIFRTPLLFLLILTFYQIPKVDLTFLLSLIFSSGIGVWAAILAYRAIKDSDVSLVGPIAAFNPVFTSIVSFLILGEVIGIKGLLGIFLIVLGAYTLQVSELKEGVLKPFMALIKNKAVRMTLFAYFIWAITPIFEKIAIRHTSPNNPPFASLIGGIITIPIYIFLVRKDLKKIPLQITINFRDFLLLGALGAVGQFIAFMAINLASLGFVTAVFKLSIIFNVVLGWMFFGEKNIKERLLGSVVMLGGVILLIL